MATLAESFDQYFEILLANTDDLRKTAYQIRHDVYSSELNWEPENTAGLEQDDHDAHSYHCLLKHRRTGAYAGTIRLVNTEGGYQAPFEVNCQAAIDSSIIDPAQLPRGKFGEISRLAVPANFRKRSGERGVPFVIGDREGPYKPYSEDERRQFPNIALGLYLASLAYVELLNYSHVFVMMEPRLRRHLVRFGIDFQAGGEAIDYHGLRGLFFLERANIRSNLPADIHDLYQLIYTTMQTQRKLT